MLDLMLANSWQGFSCGEVNALFHPWRPHHLEPDCTCGTSSCDVWKRLYRTGEKCLYPSIFDEFPEIGFVTDSSKDLVWIVDQLRNLSGTSIHVMNLLLWKSPAEYAYACWKRGKERFWHMRWVEYYARYMSVIPQWYSISYRDLVRSPMATLAQLCRVLGLDYQPGREQFWHKRHHSLFGSDSVRMHLYDKGSEAYLEIARRRSSSKPNVNPTEIQEIRNHREIYYDESYARKLPGRILRIAETDPNIRRIQAALEKHDFRFERACDYEVCSARAMLPWLPWYMKDKMRNWLHGSALKYGLWRA
jgi:hypothetical protein